MDVRNAPFPPGFSLEEGESMLSGGELERLVASATGALLAAGVRRHEPIVLHAPSSLQSLVAFLALRRSGATTVLVHSKLAMPEVEDIVARVRPRLVLAPANFSDLERAELPALVGDARALPAQYVVFTSGTEGQPKGVLLGEGGFRAHAEAVRRRLGLQKEDRWLLSLDLAHIGGLALVLRALQIGNAVVVPRDFRELDAEVRRHGITHMSVVPTQLARWMKASPTPPSGLRCVLVGGGLLDAGVAEAARRNGWPVRATYGFTEASSQVATQEPGDPDGCVGRPLDGVQVVVEGPAGTVGVGETGRITVRGPTLAFGYVDDVEGSRAVFAGGRFRTEDLGRLDERGRLWIAGRADDVIITGGENVDPAEVERVLLNHPAVADACVVGETHPEWGQAVVALVVPRGGDPGSDALRAHCAASLARFKVPKRFQVVPAVPRTANGKLRRAAARAMLNRP